MKGMGAMTRLLKWMAGVLLVLAVQAGNGDTLFDAASRNDVAAIEALLKAGADLNATIKEGLTALHLAAAGGWMSIIEALVKAGADVKVKDKQGITALAIAEAKGHVAAVKALRAYGGR